jgi:predicted transcriptional regulator
LAKRELGTLKLEDAYMTEKLSPHKLSKMMQLRFEGYSQPDIAKKLNIDQSTVSLHIGKFKSLVEQMGLEAAAEEYGVMDEVEALHSLASELKKAKLTVEEAKAGLKMRNQLQHFGVKEEDYNYFIQACTKMKDEGYIADAVKLSKLENTTGLTHTQLLAQYTGTHEKLNKEAKDLEVTTAKLNARKEELADTEKQKKAASQGLKTYMKEIGVDMNRLKLVEGLAQTLKQAGIPDKEVEGYIAHQKILHQAGIGLGTFTAILEKAKLLTSHDQGQGLLKSLSDYGGISEAIKGLQTKVALLEKQAAGLEQQAQLKGKLDAQIGGLKAEKASLEGALVELNKKKEELGHIQSQIDSLTKKKATLEAEISERKSHNDALSLDIIAREKKVSDLSQLEVKRDQLATQVAVTEAKLSHERFRLQVFDSFLAFVNSSSLVEFEKFVTALPSLLAQVKDGNVSKEILIALFVKDVAGESLQSWKCLSCGGRFTMDKPALFGYQCPRCKRLTQVVLDQDMVATLKKALAEVQHLVLEVKMVKAIKEPGSGPLCEGEANQSLQ